MDTMKMISKALEQVVEQEVSRRAGEMKLENVIQFLRTCSPEDFAYVFDEMVRQESSNCEYYRGTSNFDNYYQNRLEDDNSIINRDDIDVDTVEECGILEECFYRYVENGDEREIIKGLVDRL